MENAARRILFVYLALMLLLAVTVAATFLPLGAFGAPVSLAIGAVKAALVLFYFMKLKEASNSLRLIALGAVFWLAVMLVFTAADYLTR